MSCMLFAVEPMRLEHRFAFRCRRPLISFASPTGHVVQTTLTQDGAPYTTTTATLVLADTLRAEEVAAKEELSKRQALEEAAMAEKERLRNEEDRARREYEDRVAAEASCCSRL